MRILYLDIDALRPDHLGCYGYHRDTSPNIDKIAAKGVRFENCYCSDAPCLPSRTALMSGRFGIHSGVVGHGGTAADVRLEGRRRGFRDVLAKESLPAFLSSIGFRTATINPFAARHAAWSFYAGFNEIYNTGKGGRETAEEITPGALKWIDENADKDNWFLHITYFDPHTPYRAPEEFGNPFSDKPFPEWINDEILQNHRKMPGPHGAQEINMYDNATIPEYPRHPGEAENMQDIRKMFDGYDCGIRYVDSHIGRILKLLEQKGITESTAIIVSADHGENLGELGLYAEHATADYITCRIPLIIYWPGCKAGYVDKGFHYNLDLLPTLAELFDKKPAASWDGQSFAPVIKAGKECGRENVIVSQCAHTCQRGVRFGPWMYIRTYHDGYHLYPDEMLFNIEKDPYEQFNVAAEFGDICLKAVYLLNQWHDDMMKSMDYDVDPLWTVIREGGPFHAKGYLKEYCKRLEMTGRSYAIPELQKRHPKEFTSDRK